MVQGERAYQSLCVMAREDSALFAEMILTDEASGKPITMQPMHMEWHQVAATGRHMVLWAHPEAGKSVQLIIARTLWILGRNPQRRIGILAASEEQVKKLIGALRLHIETNQTLHHIFPELRRGKKWTDTSITIARSKATRAKDFSVCAISPGKKIQGARIDYLFIDDVLVHDNTRTAARRQEMSTWVRSAAFSRLTKRAQVVCLANAFHPDDLAHELAAQEGWWSKKYPVLNEKGESSWPEVWPPWRIQEARATMGETEFARAHLCLARGDGEARFKEAWLTACKSRGKGVPIFKSLLEFVRWVGFKHWNKAGVHWNFSKGKFQMPAGCHVFTTVDLGISKRDSADPSVIFTGFVWPDGTRQVLNIQRGKWAASEIKRRIIHAHKKFKPSMVVVENNAAQDYLIQWIEEENALLPASVRVPVVPFKTGRNKLSKEFGVESVATELELKKWLIPSGDGVNLDKEISQWCKEMLHYTPDAHTGDILMASWFFREAARVFVDRKRGNGRVSNNGGSVKVQIIGRNSKKQVTDAESGFVGLRRAA